MYSIINRHICLATLIIILAVLACGCTDTPQEQDTPSVSPLAGTALRFGIGKSTETRTTNTGIAAEFEDGDKVGGILAYRKADGSFEFASALEWEVKTQSNGDNILKLLNLVKNSDEKGTEKTDAGASSKNIKRHPDYDENQGYLELLDDGKEYCFFFYYPYYDADKIIDIYDRYTHHRKDVYEIESPFSAFCFMLNPDWDENWVKKNRFYTQVCGGVSECGTDDGNIDVYGFGSEKPLHFSWREYPVFTSIAQGSKEQSSNCDFMWTRYVTDQKEPGKPVTKEDAATHYTVNLAFRKKMAAIDLYIEDEPGAGPANTILKETVYYKNIPEPNPPMQVDNDTKFENYIVMGRKFDLTSGNYVGEYSQKNKNWQYAMITPKRDIPLSSGCQISDIVNYEYEGFHHKTTYNRIKPCPMNDGSLRVILPPQNNFKGELHFSTADGADHTVNITEKINSLKENTLYVIRLNYARDWDIRIADWVAGSGMLIEENK